MMITFTAFVLLTHGFLMVVNAENCTQGLDLTSANELDCVQRGTFKSIMGIIFNILVLYIYYRNENGDFHRIKYFNRRGCL